MSEHRTRGDYAACGREVVEVYYPQAVKIQRVQDNLNTHEGASLDQACCPAKAREWLERIEFHSTPKQGSGLNMAQTQISLLNGQGLERRLDHQQEIATEGAAWENKRNALEARLHWTFSWAVARQKLRKLYPSIED